MQNQNVSQIFLPDVQKCHLEYQPENYCWFLKDYSTILYEWKYLNIYLTIILNHLSSLHHQFEINKFFFINNEITLYQDCINSKETYKQNSIRSETTLKRKKILFTSETQNYYQLSHRQSYTTSLCVTLEKYYYTVKKQTPRQHYIERKKRFFIPSSLPLLYLLVRHYHEWKLLSST